MRSLHFGVSLVLDPIVNPSSLHYGHFTLNYIALLRALPTPCTMLPIGSNHEVLSFDEQFQIMKIVVSNFKTGVERQKLQDVEREDSRSLETIA